MSYDPNNLFAQILRGDLGCVKVYEDEETLAFMDIMPQSEGHTLVIPKEPAVTLLELSDDAAAATVRTVKKIGNAIKEAYGPGVTAMQLNDAEAGQTVPHIHFHLIPGSILNAKPHAREVEKPEVLQAAADKIIACL